MTFKLNKNPSLSEQDTKRTKRIISKLNLKKLPFKITEEQFCSSYTEMFRELTPLFKYKPREYAMKWCLSTEKRMRVFLLIFEANELGEEIYKEILKTNINGIGIIRVFKNRTYLLSSVKLEKANYIEKLKHKSDWFSSWASLTFKN